MKRNLLTLVAYLSCISFAVAQDFNDPVSYMNAIENAHTVMDKTYMAYVSAAAHSRRAKKIDRMREQTLESISDAKYKLADLPLYKADNSLRKGYMDYTDFLYKVFNDDYAHIVNLGEIAEQSVDEMEALILLQEKTDEKIKEANKRADSAYKLFAAKYNVTLVKGEESDLEQKLAIAGKLNHYMNDVFIIFFKCNWQDGQITDAINKKNLANIEQSRNALIAYADEGLKALGTVKDFEGDGSFAAACKRALVFYKRTAETDMPKLLDFYLKEDNFEKIKKAFNAKSESSRTKQDVDTYNNAVKDMNNGVNSFNALNDKINNERNQVINDYNNTENSFRDMHTPHYKK